MIYKFVTVLVTLLILQGHRTPKNVTQLVNAGNHPRQDCDFSCITPENAMQLVETARLESVIGGKQWSIDGRWLLVQQFSESDTYVLRYDAADFTAPPCEMRGRLTESPAANSDRIRTYQDVTMWLWDAESCEQVEERIFSEYVDVNPSYPWTIQTRFDPDGRCGLVYNGMKYSRSLTTAYLQLITAAGETCPSLAWRGYDVRDYLISADAAVWIYARWDDVNLVEQTQLLMLPLHGATEIQQLDEGISAIQLAPDGKLLAAGTQNGKVRLFDLTTSRQTAELDTGTSYAIGKILFSASGEQIAVYGQQYDFEESHTNYLISIWDVPRQQITLIDLPWSDARYFFDFTLNPSGDLLGAAFYDLNGIRTTDIINIADGRTLITLTDISDLSWSPDRTRIAAVTSGEPPSISILAVP